MGARKLTAVEPLEIDGATVAAGATFTTSADIGRQLVAVGAAVRTGQPVPDAKPGRSWRVRGSIVERCRAPAGQSIEPAPGDRASEVQALAAAAGVKGAAPVAAAQPIGTPSAVKRDSAEKPSGRVAELLALARRAGLKGYASDSTAVPSDGANASDGRAAELTRFARESGLSGYKP